MKYSVFALFALSLVVFSGCEPGLEPSVEEETGEGVEMEATVEEGMDEEGAEETEEAMDESAEAESRLVVFDQNEYEAALAAGKTIFLDFHADWCPTCVSNKPSIEAAFENMGDANVIGFVVNYDTEIDLKKEYGVLTQSTLVVVPAGDKDAARSMVGLVTEESVTEFIQG